MTFATRMTAAGMVSAAATAGSLVAGTPVLSRADGIVPQVVRRDQTILIPIPECPRYRPVLLGQDPEDDAFRIDCVRDD
jgi:hypothetical protein